jgi:hypothetical protein
MMVTGKTLRKAYIAAQAVAAAIVLVSTIAMLVHGRSRKAGIFHTTVRARV